MKALATLLPFAIVSFFIAPFALANDVKHPGQAGNDNIDLTGTVLDATEVHDQIGADMPAGFVVMKVKALPKIGEPMRISPDDFVLVSRKNGDRAEAMAPAMITTHSALTLKRDTRGRDWAQQTNQPGFVGVGSIRQDGAETKQDDALLAALKAKELPDQDTKQAIEGLLYFSLDASKLKTKDLALVYKGPGGHLTIEFK